MPETTRMLPLLLAAVRLSAPLPDRPRSLPRRADRGRPGGGFTVTWRNFAAATDPGPAAPITARENALTFVPSGRPGLWRAAGAGDPVAGTAAWAIVAGDVLTVDVIAVDDEGDLERRTYVRT